MVLQKKNELPQTAEPYTVVNLILPF